MAIQPVVGAHPALAASGLEPRQQGGQPVARLRCMVQVAGDAAEQQSLPRDPCVLEAGAELLVFRTPADEFLVEAALPLIGPLIRYEGWLVRA